MDIAKEFGPDILDGRGELLRDRLGLRDADLGWFFVVLGLCQVSASFGLWLGRRWGYGTGLIGGAFLRQLDQQLRRLREERLDGRGIQATMPAQATERGGPGLAALEWEPALERATV